MTARKPKTKAITRFDKDGVGYVLSSDFTTDYFLPCSSVEDASDCFIKENRDNVLANIGDNIYLYKIEIVGVYKQTVKMEKIL